MTKWICSEWHLSREGYVTVRPVGNGLGELSGHYIVHLIRGKLIISNL